MKNENDVESAYETHLLIDMGNGGTLGYKGDKLLKWVDVVSY